jgi:type IX secretion system PorP/SprF family membrane protein
MPMKRTIPIFILLLFSLAGFSQTRTNNRYILDPVSINPAFAGGRGALNLSTFYGRQWVGVAGSPTTMVFSADAPLAADKLGLGLMLINDRIGVTKENQFVSSYAYKIHMDNSVLAFGLGAGVVLTNTAYSDLIVIDPGDEIFLQY